MSERHAVLGATAQKAMAAPWGATQPATVPTEDDKLWGMLANVLGLIFIIGPLITLLVKGGSSIFVKFYSLQMIMLHVVGLVLAIILGVLFNLVGSIPLVGTVLLQLVSPLLGLAALALLIFLALQAHKGVVYKLPLIGGLAFEKSAAAK